MMQLLAHEDPNVRYESLLAVQKLMVHNWYAAQYFVTYGFLIYFFFKQGILGQTIGKGYQARFGELVGRCQDQRLKRVKKQINMMVCFKLVPDFLVLHKNEIRGRDTIVHSTLSFYLLLHIIVNFVICVITDNKN